MSRAVLAFLLVSSLPAQTPGNVFDKAPPEVDAALRDRITKFFQAHVDGKTRQAEQYVAEDTKDYFFEGNKPHYLDFRIDTITYSDHFTKAKAVVFCKQRILMPGFAEHPVDLPTPSTWKLENGQWYWYVDQSKGSALPFGLVEPPSGTAQGARAPKTLSMSSGPSVQTLWNSVRADKNTVQLSGKTESSDQVTISNKMPGNITLLLDAPKSSGFDVALDRTELKAGEQATLTFHSHGQEIAAARKAEVRITVMPTNQLIPIAVSIQ